MSYGAWRSSVSWPKTPANVNASTDAALSAPVRTLVLPQEGPGGASRAGEIRHGRPRSRRGTGRRSSVAAARGDTPHHRDAERPAGQDGAAPSPRRCPRREERASEV